MQVDLSASEFEAVTDAFGRRLSEAMGRAGCNDLFEDEFPPSVCARFRWDSELLDVWLKQIALLTDTKSFSIGLSGSP